MPSSQASPSPLHALIVDDLQAYRRIMEVAVKKLGWTSAEAVDGESALLRLERETFDVVFLDWELPDINGAEVIRQARLRLPGRVPLIIVASAHPPEIMSAHWSEAGADGWIIGAPTSKALQRAVNEARGSRQPGSVPNESRAVPSPDLLNALWQDINHETSRLKTAVDEREFAAAARTAHNVRGLAGLLGARPLADLAERCERAAQMTDLPALQSACRDLAGATSVLNKE